MTVFNVSCDDVIDIGALYRQQRASSNDASRNDASSNDTTPSSSPKKLDGDDGDDESIVDKIPLTLPQEAAKKTSTPKDDDNAMDIELGDEDDEGDDDNNNNNNNTTTATTTTNNSSNKTTPTSTPKKEKKAKKNKGGHLQREDYSSMVDYLEAKYVRGIVCDISGGESSDGEGSVYEMEPDFIDDSGMIHAVEEQV